MVGNLIVLIMVDGINFLKIKEDLIFLLKIEDDLIFLSNGRRPQYSCEWKMNSKTKNKQCNLNQIKNDCYAVLKNSTAQ